MRFVRAVSALLILLERSALVFLFELAIRPELVGVATRLGWGAVPRLMSAARFEVGIDLPIDPLVLATAAGRGDRTTDLDKMAADGRVPPNDRFGVNDARLGRIPAGPNAAGPPLAVAND